MGVLVLGVAVLVGNGMAAADDTATVRVPIELGSSYRNQTTVVVSQGDSLWKISERHLQRADRALAPYWLEVIEVNTPSLRSGDPDLIYPGEVIELP